jgi:hypothetical protein
MADIILFPERNPRIAQPVIGNGGGSKPGETSASPVCVVDAHEPRPLADAPDGNAVVRAIALCEAARQSGQAPLPDMSWVIRSAMPWLKRRGRKWSSLPELHRGLLEQHCAAGNPTAIMFRDWIEGRHLDGLVHSAGDARSMDLLPSATATERGF